MDSTLYQNLLLAILIGSFLVFTVCVICVGILSDRGFCCHDSPRLNHPLPSEGCPSETHLDVESHTPQDVSSAEPPEKHSVTPSAPSESYLSGQHNNYQLLGGNGSCTGTTCSSRSATSSSNPSNPTHASQSLIRGIARKSVDLLERSSSDERYDIVVIDARQAGILPGGDTDSHENSPYLTLV